MTEIDIEPDNEEDARLWSSVGDLASVLPGEWVLIGGLMVQLHALEHGVREVRTTVDVDVLGQVRPEGTLEAIDLALLCEGFEAAEPDPDGYAHRYRRDGLIVDVLAPEGTRAPASLGGGRSALGVPGGSQAISRAEDVVVRLGTRTFALRRPTLAGAILIKARSLMVHHDPAAQREDLIMLLSLVEDPRSVGESLRRSERGWLRRAEGRLAFDAPVVVGAERVRRARLAFALLTR
jgi:hypothetical protein